MGSLLRFQLLWCALVQVSGFAGIESIPAHHASLSHTLTLAHQQLESLQSSTTTLAKVVLRSYTDTLSAHPLSTKVMTGATLAIAGDAIAQSREPDPYDTNRAASFGVFDMAYRATQHALFPIIVRECHGQFILGALSALPWLAHMVSVENAASMECTLASQLGIVPFLYYPVFFSLTGAMQGLSVEGSIKRAQENFIPLMQRNLLFWIPVQFIQFGFIEENLQIPFLSVCGLCWTFILSVMAGSAKSYNDNEATTTNNNINELTSTDAHVNVVAEAAASEIYSTNCSNDNNDRGSEVKRIHLKQKKSSSTQTKVKL